MIFWLFLILTIVAVAVGIATSVASNNYDYHDKKGNKKIVVFAYQNRDWLCFTSSLIALISGIISLIMLTVIIFTYVTADGYIASNEQRYDALVYKAQTESIRDEFGIVNKEYIDEVQEWNEGVKMHQAYSDNFWIGIFYPKRLYDGFSTINLEDIKMRQ